MFPHYFPVNKKNKLKFIEAKQKRMLYDKGVMNVNIQTNKEIMDYNLNLNQDTNYDNCNYTNIINIKNDKKYSNSKYISTENKLLNMNYYNKKYPTSRKPINSKNYYKNIKNENKCNNFLLSTPTRLEYPPILEKSKMSNRLINLYDNGRNTNNKNNYLFLKKTNNSSRDIAIQEYKKKRNRYFTNK